MEIPSSVGNDKYSIFLDKGGQQHFSTTFVHHILLSPIEEWIWKPLKDGTQSAGIQKQLKLQDEEGGWVGPLSALDIHLHEALEDSGKCLHF